MQIYVPIQPGLSRGADGDWYDEASGSFLFSPLSESYSDEAVQLLTTNVATELVNWDTVALPAGQYSIELSFGWNYNATNSDIIVDFEIDGASPDGWGGSMLRAEPKEVGGNVSGTGSNQSYPFCRKFLQNLSGVTNFTLDLRGENNVNAAIWGLVLTCHRIQ